MTRRPGQYTPLIVLLGNPTAHTTDLTGEFFWGFTAVSVLRAAQEAERVGWKLEGC